MPEQRFQEFYDEYAATRYPFLDTCLLRADTGQVLDTDLFLDASLYPVGNTLALHIATITVQSRLVVISIADSKKVVVATTSFDPFGGVAELAVVDIYGRPAGVIVSDAARLSRFSSWVEGTHTFTVTAAVFVPSCIIPTPATGVRGIGTSQGDVLTDAVVLVGGPGVVLRAVGDAGIRIDIIGDPLYRRRLCEVASAFQTPLFVQTINNCPPDQHGNISITVGNHLTDKTILRLNQSADGLIIEANGVVA
jgi:hypothetical protein